MSTQTTERPPIFVCRVCGSSAPITREHASKGTLHLCYAHEAVCWPHLEDPCRFCDGGEPEPNRDAGWVHALCDHAAGRCHYPS